MITNKKYILFDLDGTLTDPKVGICTCAQHALKELGIDEPDLDKLEPFIGPPLKDSFMRYYGLTEAQAETAIEKYRERFSVTGKFENKVYEGIPQLLKDLKDYGYKLAVASSKPECFVKDILVHFNIARYFDVVVGSELDGTRVDKNEVIHETLNRLFHYRAFQKDQVVMVGDRRFDIEGAREIGVASVAVAYGYGPMKELKSARPQYIANTVQELRELFIDEEELPKRRAEAEAKAIEEIKAKAAGNASQNMGQGKKNNQTSDNRTPMQRIWRLAFPLILFYVTIELLRQLAGMVLMALAQKNEMLYQFMLNLEETTDEVWALSGNGTTLIQILANIGTLAALYTMGNGKRYLAKTKKENQEKSFSPKEWAAWIGLILILGIGINMFFVSIGWISINTDYLETANKMYAVSIPLGVLFYGLISPFTEELLFRGIIFAEAKRFMKPFTAVLVSSAMFGFYHGNTVQLFYSFLLGMVLAQAYQYSGKFLVPVAMHGAVNVVVFLGTNMLLFRENTLQLVLGAVLTVAGGVLFFLFKKYYDAKDTV